MWAIVVDAGGRFTGLPEKLELSPENFMKAFEMGVKNSRLGIPLTDEEVEKKKIAENKKIEKQAETLKEKEKKKQEEAKIKEEKTKILKLFKSKAQDLTGEQLILIKGINQKYGIKSFDNVDDIDIKALKEINKIISE